MRVGSGVDKGVIIVFCDDCGVRVPEGDLASGAAVRVGENRARCAKCAPSKKSGRAKRSGAGASPVGRKVAGVPPKRSTSARITPVRSASKAEASSARDIRKHSLTAWLDGKVIRFWPTDYSDCGLRKDWKLRVNGVLGLGAYKGKVTFNRVQLREVTGKGRLK